MTVQDKHGIGMSCREKHKIIGIKTQNFDKKK